MNLIMRVDASDNTENELRSLYGWLRDEEELRGTTRISLLDRPPAPGEMGGTLEAVQAIFDSGVQVGALVAGILSWLESRHSRKSAKPVEINLVLELGGRQLSVAGASREQIEAFIEASNDGVS